jgi:transketolase
VRQAFADTVLEVGLKDEKLVVLVGDISHNLLQPFAKACPGRYYNVGIMEQTIVGMAAGLALAGLYPVVHTITPFLVERAYEQLKLDFGYQKLGGVMIGVGGAFDYSGLGCSHHSYAACKLVAAIPGSQVFTPASPSEFNTLFKAVYRQPKLSYFHLPAEGHGQDVGPVTVGVPITLRTGSKGTIVAVGPQLRTAIEADVPDWGIVYLHTLKPRPEIPGRVIWLEEANFDEFQHGYGTRQDHLKAVGLTPERVRELAA